MRSFMATPPSDCGEFTTALKRGTARRSGPGQSELRSVSGFNDDQIVAFANGLLVVLEGASATAQEIDIVLIDRKDLPSAGAGETGIVGLAPAVSNAIFAATGTRLRNMPMAVSGELTS
jgi:hypothetical protein